MKEWFTSQELASFGLSGMPNTDRAYRIRAQKNSWTERNKAIGKGLEYHVSNLPEPAQVELIEKLIGTDKLDTLKNCHSYDDLCEGKPHKITTEERTRAKIIICGLFEKFRTSTHLPILKAETAFLQFYQSQIKDNDYSFVPEWVVQVYPSFSVQSLRIWRSKRKTDKALKELAPKYGNRKGSGTLDTANDGEVAKFIASLITTHTHLTGGHLRDLVRSKFGRTLTVKKKNGDTQERELPNVRSFERWVVKWKAENQDLYLKLTDPDAYKSHKSVAFGSASDDVHRLNQLWEIDASPADAFCNDGRYNLYAIIDVWSRRTLFSVSKTPCTEASLLLVRRAILEWGVPEKIKIDNGKDFVSKRFQEAILDIGIEPDICPPFSPEKKPHVERVIGTMQRDLMPLLKGFVGHNVSDRKKIEASKTFSQRLGESDKDAFKIEMSSDDLQKYLDDWALQRYAHRKHGSLGTTPFEKAQSWAGAISTINNERALDVLLAPIAVGGGQRKVTKNGLRIAGSTYISEDLSLFIGKEVFVRHDPSDMGVIYVFDLNKNFLCTAQNAALLGIDRKEVAEAAKKARKHKEKEAKAQLAKARRDVKQSDLVNMVLQQHADEAKNIVTFPKTEEKHESTALDEAVKAITKPSVPEKTELDEKAQKAHLALVKELSEPKAKEPLSIADMTRDQRYEMAVRLEERLKNGERISEDNERWLKGYQKHAEYRSQKAMREDFKDFYKKEKK